MFIKDMIYNDVDISQFVVVEDIRRDILPTISNYTRKIPNRPGLLHRNSEVNSKIIEVDIRMIEDSRLNIKETKDKLVSFLLFKNPQKLELRDEPDKYDLAILDGTFAFERFKRTGFTTLVFLNPLGISFSKTLSTGTTNNGNTNTPFIFEGTISTPGTASISNGVDTITIDTGGYTAGASIKIDTDFEDVIINGYHDMGDVYLESDFFWLSPGVNNLTIEGLTGTISHRARWL